MAHILAQIKPGVMPGTVLYDSPNKDAKTCQEWIETAQRAKETAKNSRERTQIERQELALLHHTKQAPATSSDGIEKQLLDLRQRYKKLFPNDSEPSDFEKEQLHYLAEKYPDYAQRLLALEPGDEWATAFLKFCLRSPSLSVRREIPAKHWIDIFILYPDEADQIMASQLDERLGQYPEHLKIIDGKGLCLHMDVKEGFGKRWVPIQGQMKKATVFLKNRVDPNATPLALSVEEIYTQFKEKTWKRGDVEMCEDGLVAWSSIHLGSKSPDRPEIDRIDPAKWHESLPILTLTYDQLTKRYEGQIVGEPKYGLVLRASRASPDLSVAHADGFFDFVYQLPNGHYRVVPAGFQSADLPKTWLDRLLQISATQRAAIQLLNEGDAQREQMMVFYALSNAEGEELAPLVAKEIEKCRTGKRYFQASGKNTAYVVQRIVDRILGGSFYKGLIELALKHLGESQRPKLEKQLQHAVKSLDPKAFTQFIQPVVEKMVAKNAVDDLHELLTVTLTTLNRMLQKKEATELSIPSVEKISSAFAAGKKAEITDSFIKLTELCMDVLHPYRIHASEGVISTPILRHIFWVIRIMPWNWLRNLLTDIMLFILGSWRGHSFETVDKKSGLAVTKTVRLMYSRNAGRHLNLPAKLFMNCAPAAFDRKTHAINTSLALFSGKAI